MWIAAGIDGFRYDLATVLGRGTTVFNVDTPLLRAIRDDAVIGKTLHIAEPWDIGPGGYQLGKFPAGWSEWNDTLPRWTCGISGGGDGWGLVILPRALPAHPTCLTRAAASLLPALIL